MWCLAVLLNYPDLQSVLYEEISRETGQKLPSVDHKENLPKLQAFIQEIYRNLTLLPLGLQHKTMADVELCGYHIPKNTVIFTNLHAVHSDSKTWEDPSKFDIYRHINKNGKFVPSKKVIPFGIGARSCIGEKLAQTEIYLFLANIIKRFEILPDLGSKHPPPLNDGVTGFAFTPFSFKVVLKIRNSG
uniref:Uncharacterized protein n=1 Tax=Ciona savignyi TaxID=51511 RepID=H2YCS4_CIOSA